MGFMETVANATVMSHSRKHDADWIAYRVVPRDRSERA